MRLWAFKYRDHYATDKEQLLLADNQQNVDFAKKALILSKGIHVTLKKRNEKLKRLAPGKCPLSINIIVLYVSEVFAKSENAA